MEMLKVSVKLALERRNYEVYESKGCFDLAAKKDNFLLLKVLKNIDGFLLEHAISLKAISAGLDAYPFLIGENTNHGKLISGVVYERFEIPAMNLATFEMVLDGEFPEILRDKGGFYVEIDPVKLRLARKEKKLTQKELARLVGVSKKTIYLHEKKPLRAEISVVRKIEEILGKSVRRSAEIFRKFEKIACSPKNELERFVENKLREFGFTTSFISSAPCDVIARENELIISEVETNKRRLAYRAKKFERFLRFLDTSGVIVTEKFKIELDIPVIEKEELGEIETKKEFIKLIRGC
jgi:putative transcriptional regulator